MRAAGLAILVGVSGCRGGAANPRAETEPPGLSGVSGIEEITAPSWAEVLAVHPDREVVPDRSLRAQIVATGLAWWVRDRATGIELRLVPPGSYLRGSESSNARSEEAPTHEAQVTEPFYLGVTEITQEEWRAVMGDHPFEFPGARQPAENLRVPDIEEFLRRTSFDLPTEVEWEWVARATAAVRPVDLTEEVWSQRDGVLGPQPVATKRANALGIFDLFGNVWELTRGDWTSDYRDAQSRAPVTADRERERWRGSYYQSFRGGSWVSPEEDLRPARRQRYSPGSGFYDTGFRVWRPGRSVEGERPSEPRGESR